MSSRDGFGFYDLRELLFHIKIFVKNTNEQKTSLGGESER